MVLYFKWCYRIRSFNFLSSLSPLLNILNNKLHICFVGEWLLQQRISYHHSFLLCAPQIKAIHSKPCLSFWFDIPKLVPPHRPKFGAQTSASFAPKLWIPRFFSPPSANPSRSAFGAVPQPVSFNPTHQAIITRALPFVWQLRDVDIRDAIG